LVSRNRVACKTLDAEEAPETARSLRHFGTPLDASQRLAVTAARVCAAPGAPRSRVSAGETAAPFGHCRTPCQASGEAAREDRPDTGVVYPGSWPGSAHREDPCCDENTMRAEEAYADRASPAAAGDGMYAADEDRRPTRMGQFPGSPPRVSNHLIPCGREFEPLPPNDAVECRGLSKRVVDSAPA